jgi:hypothetical protein
MPFLRPPSGFGKLTYVLVRTHSPFPHQDGAPHALGTRGLVGQMPGLRRRPLQGGDRAQLVCVPEVQPPHAHQRPRAADEILGYRLAQGNRGQGGVRGSAAIQGHQALPLVQAQKITGERDALIVMAGQVAGLDVVACAFEFSFLGGSMGSVVGEKFVRAVEHCLEHRVPLVCFAASGGARMQEALYSLLQMAKTSAALKRLSEARLPFISVMTDPTTGGVSASLAMLGDINIGEPKALIGFAGPRVIQQTVRETLPEGFQRSEFLLEHGALDMIVDRREMRDRIGAMLRLLSGKEPAAA